MGRGGRNEWARAHFFFALEFLGTTTAAYDSMALDLEKIRALADRVAASHGLAIVDIEYLGSPKHRALRIYIEKDAANRAKLAGEMTAEGNELKLPEHVSVDQLAGIRVEDCQVFSDDFGTVLDVEELVPGAEYTLEVSSPGLDRKLHGVEDFRRFAGMLVKVQTFEPVAGNRHWQGRLTEVTEQSIRLELQGRQGARAKKRAEAEAQSAVEIALSQIEKAQLVPEF